MKRKDLNELKNKDYKDLKKMLDDKRRDLTKTIVEAKMGSVKNVHETRNRKKEIAYILTFMNIKKLTISEKPKEKETKNGTN